jgi:hypothetical protein
MMEKAKRIPPASSSKNLLHFQFVKKSMGGLVEETPVGGL